MIGCAVYTPSIKMQYVDTVEGGMEIIYILNQNKFTYACIRNTQDLLEGQIEGSCHRLTPRLGFEKPCVRIIMLMSQVAK